jgi:hypothetical protein
MTTVKNLQKVRQFDYLIDCKREIIHPATGKPILSEKDKMLTFGASIGAILSEEKSDFFKPMKAWLLSQKFYTLPKVGLDAEDFGNLKKAIEASGRWVPFVIGQVMEYLEGLKRE